MFAFSAGSGTQSTQAYFLSHLNIIAVCIFLNMYDIRKTCQQHKVGSNLAQRQHISDEGLVSRLTPFLAHELQQSSMFSTRRTFQDFLGNIHQTSVRDQARDQDSSYPMLLRTHILPCLAGDWVRVVAPQKAMKTEKSRRSFILIQDARLWGI